MMKYKLLGPSGLRVSEFALGTMTFGLEWKWGADKDESKRVFDLYANSGGNFIDTANRYTEGTSEKFVGEFIASDRDHFVVATKYSLYDRLSDPNYCGNHRKNLMRSVEQSLRRLQTDYIDLLWLHMWDATTPVDEIMRALDDLVRQGKVHYIGISDTPAWVVSQANTLAELRGWAKFVALQIEYSLLQRTPERELLPMAKAFGLTVTPWGAIGGGALTGKYLRNETGRLPEHSSRRSERAGRIAAVVVQVAEELGVTPAQVAIQWTRQNLKQSVIPIIGARTEAQLRDNLGALNLTLPDDAMAKLNEASAIELGFPHDFLKTDAIKTVLYGGIYDHIERRYD
ncbi:MAG: aldo/keto reductase [Chloroherpetonaceae bacterium]|nr:aldo/keto reductase [Chloroherpetonaceae bacterium]